jgi:hypothetical protein
LAAALVAFDTKNAAAGRLIDEPVANTLIVLMVVTSIRAPSSPSASWDALLTVRRFVPYVSRQMARSEVSRFDRR